MPITIEVCAYVPGTIIVGYCPEIGEVKCDNNCPHITLLLGGDTKPV